MYILKEGEKDPRPFIRGDFSLPGYERNDLVSVSEQLCIFLATTGHKIGPKEIQKLVLVKREIDWKAVEVQAGIDAGGGWWIRRRLRKKHEDANYCLPWVQDKVAELEKNGYFDELVSQMQKEYESGQNFVEELIPAFLNRFPEYSLVINRFERDKNIMFVGSDLQQGVVEWRVVGPDEFSVSVGEVREALPDEERDFNDFAINGKRFWAHDFVGVWYPTKDRDTTYDIDDTDRRTELLHLSFDTLDNFLEQYEQYYK